MNPLEIVLLIIGIIIIIISCMLVDKAANLPVQTAGSTLTPEDYMTEENKQQLKDKIDGMLHDSSEEVIVHTDDALSKLSNEKIMAVNDFSEQILEKINRNHEEVVFLYNMLNDKEKELKSAVREIDSSKKKVEDILDQKAKSNNEPSAKQTKPQGTANSALQSSHGEKSSKAVQNQAASLKDDLSLDSIGENNNKQILSLYSQGKSVMEISKLLDLGQGEVKLVIDLFKGKK